MVAFNQFKYDFVIVNKILWWYMQLVHVQSHVIYLSTFNFKIKRAKKTI